jgi:hypothetical protein
VSYRVELVRSAERELHALPVMAHRRVHLLGANQRSGALRPADQSPQVSENGRLCPVGIWHEGDVMPAEGERVLSDEASTARTPELRRPKSLGRTGNW